MKTLKEILNTEPVFCGNWSSKFEVIADFEDVYMSQIEYEAEKSPYKNVQVWLENKARMEEALRIYENRQFLFAYYSTEGYEGEAFVFFEENGKLYEVNGSHCSCYGLENQFAPEEVTLEELHFRAKKGACHQYGGQKFIDFILGK